MNLRAGLAALGAAAAVATSAGAAGAAATSSGAAAAAAAAGAGTAGAGTAVAAPAVAAPAAADKAPPPIEYTLSLQQDEWRVRATLRPGEPQPNHLVEILFDVGRQAAGAASDAVPAPDAKLALVITGPGTRTRLLARPLGDAGIYGVHWTPAAKGLWTLSLAPYAGEGPQVSFQVGAGVPMPASAQGHAVQASRVVVAAGTAGSAEAPTLKALMAEIGQRWLRAFDSGADPAAQAAALAALVRATAGHVPRDFSNDAPEYDALTQDLAAALDKAAALKDRARVTAALAPLDQASCLRCHVKFRDGLVADLSGWPAPVRKPQEAKPWKP